MPSLLWLRRLAAGNDSVVGLPGVSRKRFRDCTDEDLRVIAAHYAQIGFDSPLDEKYWFRAMLEAREEARNPLPGVGLLPLLSLLWLRLLAAAARRNKIVLVLLRWLYRAEGRLRRGDYDDIDIEGDSLQMVLSDPHP